jgi:hypothetical protein
VETSPSYESNVVLRSPQGESHFGARVAIDPVTGAMQALHHDVVVDASHASLRVVAGRWLLDAATGGRISINAVPVAGARLVLAGDVITIAGSQLLVEEASPQKLALRRFDLVGNETLPPVADTVRTLEPPAEDLAIDMG